MLQFIIQQFAFYIALVIVLFLPGYFLFKAYQGKYRIFTQLETGIFSFVFSIVLVDFLMLIMNRIGWHFSRWSLLTALLLLFASLFGAYKWRLAKANAEIEHEVKEPVFSRKQKLIIFSLVFATILIKTIYLSGAILPSATDLGHHMYWSKAIAQQGFIPAYEKADITPDNQLLTTPIADFIIGEHLIFTAIGLISGLDFISAFPVLTLYLIHLATIAAIFVLALELFKEHVERKNIAILALLFAGPLFAISSPQMKFVSGGVIGNTIGNLFIPVTLYFLARALHEKKSAFLVLTIFSGLGMAYTHHLSTFVFIFVFLFAGLFFLLTNLRSRALWHNLKDWFLMILKPWPLFVLFFSLLAVFLIYTPTYLNTKAIDTAVGSPVKATRLGYTLAELTQTAGEGRLALAIFALVLLCWQASRKKIQTAILAGWLLALIVMSMHPDWLFIDIPSNRIASYVVFPVALFCGYAVAAGLALLRDKAQHRLFLQPLFFVSTFFLLLTFSLQSGQRENTDLINNSNDASGVVQTYHSANYLAGSSDSNDIVLKDHNYLQADSWIKLSFMRGYNYPLSRGYFKRYEDVTKPREMCTFQMISTPESPEAKACFAGTGTDFVMVNPQFDSAQFKKAREFWQVYAANSVGIFYRHTN